MSDISDDKLTPVEVQSAAWQRVRVHAEARLGRLRLELESKLDQDQTNHLRGRIFELKELLRMEEPREKFKSASVVR